MILANKIECRQCGEIIESKYRHDYVCCGCGAVCCDGGKDYLKRSAKNMSDVIERSVTLNPGDVVSKKSGKPFQNREKTAVILSFSTMSIPMAHPNQDKRKGVDCVYLVECKGCVAISGLKKEN